MQNNGKAIYAPFIRKNDSVWEVMSDVLLALLPCAAMAYLAYGGATFWLMLVAVVSAVIAEVVFAGIFLKRKDTLKDGSALVTAILLAFTLAPFTPWYVVAFGSAMAVIFGKILWGGVGHNLFNPALVGREFMTIFFPAVMTSRAIWYNANDVNFKEIDVFSFFGDGAFVNYLNTLFFKSSGAIGEYSVLFLILGGIYLLLRRRISWHIPFGLLVTFFILLQVFADRGINFSLGGLLLGTIFMATDMPSSPSSKWGKLYYGALIGLTATIFILNDVKYEYMSYSILLVNGFSRFITWAFRPQVWGSNTDWIARMWYILLLTTGIVSFSVIVVLLHQYDLVRYLVFGYILFIISRFCFVTMKEIK